MSFRRFANASTKLRGALYAVSDQCIFSVGQLLLNVVLARALSPGDFGAASAVLAVISFQYILHCAFLHEPLLIRQRFASRATALMICGIVLGSTLLILMGASVSNGRAEFGWSSVALIATSETFWLARTLNTAARRFKALCFYGVALCICYYMLLTLCELDNWRVGFWFIALAQFPFAFLVLLRLGSFVGSSRNSGDEGLTVRQSSVHGVQATIAQLSSWIMTGGTIIFLGSSANAEQGGLLKIYITLLLPMQYVLGALGYYMLPKLASDWRLGKRAETYRMVALFTMCGLLAAEAFGSLVYFVGPSVVSIVFGEAYAAMDFSPFLYAPVVFAITMCLRTAFRATGQLIGMVVCSLIGALAFAVGMSFGTATVSYLRSVACMTVGFSVTAATMLCWLTFGGQRVGTVRPPPCVANASNRNRD